MARLPQPGGDHGNWGTILNEYLKQSHKSDGTLKEDSVTAATIQDGSITENLLASVVQTKLNQVAPVTSVASKTGAVTLTKSDVGLANVDNTTDADKPISTAVQTALDGKVGKGQLVVNVKDYGALGTNSDDTAAITAALDALIAITGADNAAGVLYFPAGKYRDTALRVIPANKRIHVRGAGQDTTILNRPTGATNGDWWTFNARHSGMSELTLEGGRYQGVTGDNIVLNASYSYVNQVWSGKAGGNGITIGKAAAAIVHRLHAVMVRENAANGIESVSASGSTDGMWSDIEVGNNGQYGVYLGTGSQNISNLHVWGSGLEHATQFDGIFIASGNNELVNVQSEKNLGRGIRIESNGNTIRGRCWGNCFGAIYMVGVSYNEIDLVAYRNSVLNTSGSSSDSYVQCYLSGTSVRNRIRMKVWDDTSDMAAGSYTTAPTYPYPGRSGSIRTQTRALVTTSVNCDFNVYDFDAPHNVTRLSAGVAPYTVLGTSEFFSPSCYWGTASPLPTRSVVTGVVRVPPDSDTIIVADSQEITSVLGHRPGRVIRIIWTNASPQPIRDNGTTLNLNGDFSPTTYDVMSLVSDGTNWYEISRSAN